MQGLNSPSWGLVLVRVAAGWILLKAGWDKVSAGVSDELVTGTRESFAAAPAWVRDWGEVVVLRNPSLFAHLIAWGELLGGLALFLGALTRPVGLALTFMFVNFAFVGPPSALNLVLLLGVSCLACALSRAGAKAGADVFLDERLPRWITLTRG